MGILASRVIVIGAGSCRTGPGPGILEVLNNRAAAFTGATETGLLKVALLEYQIVDGDPLFAGNGRADGNTHMMRAIRIVFALGTPEPIRRANQ